MIADPEYYYEKERVKIEVRHSCTTNNINDPNYFEDYYEDKWVTRKKKLSSK